MQSPATNVFTEISNKPTKRPTRSLPIRPARVKSQQKNTALYMADKRKVGVKKTQVKANTGARILKCFKAIEEEVNEVQTQNAKPVPVGWTVLPSLARQELIPTKPKEGATWVAPKVLEGDIQKDVPPPIAGSNTSRIHNVVDALKRGEDTVAEKGHSNESNGHNIPAKLRRKL